MKLWILGKTGLLGNALAELCIERKIDFTITSRQDADITSLESLESAASKINPTYIVNCTAFNDVDGAEKTPEKAYAINSLGPQNLGKLGIKVTHISTDYVFDGEKNTPYKEEDPCSPLSVYGKSKREGEVNLLTSTPNALVIRTSWLFGKGGKNFISALLNILKTQEVVKTTSDQIGSPTYAKDLARGILSSLDYSGLFHFSNVGEVSRFEVANYFMELAKDRAIPLLCNNLLPISTKEVNFIAKRPMYSALDIGKIKNALGFAPRTWQEAVEDYVDAIW